MLVVVVVKERPPNNVLRLQRSVVVNVEDVGGVA